jgi:hypothetical protein
MGWNMTVEHEFPEVETFTLSYVGRRGYISGNWQTLTSFGPEPCRQTAA